MFDYRLQELEDKIKNEPNDISNYLNKAYIIGEQDKVALLSYLSDVYQIFPDDYAVCMALAKCQQDNHHYAEAIVLYEQAYTMQNEDPACWFSLLELYTSSEQLDKAKLLWYDIVEYAQGNKDHPLLARAFQSLSSIHLQQGEYTNALQYINMALKNKHSDFYTNILKAEILYALKEYEPSISFYKRALQFDEDDVGICSKIADIYMECEDFQQAIHYYEKEMQKHEKQADLCYYIAKAYLALSRVDRAKHFLFEALKCDVIHVAANVLLATIFIDEKQYKQAIHYLDNALSESNDVEIYAHKGHCFEQLERYEEAIELYEIAITIAPTHAFTYYRIACVYYSIEAYQSALDCYQLAKKHGYDAALCEDGISDTNFFIKKRIRVKT